MMDLATTSWLTLASTSPREVEEFVTEFRRLPEGWWAVGGLAVVALLCWAVIGMYRREGRVGASPRVRWLLAAVRCAVLMTLAVILLEPVLVRVIRRWVDSYTVVLLDNSSSMDLADAYRGAAEAQRVKRVLGEEPGDKVRRSELVARLLNQENRKFLRDLTRRNRVRIYTFGKEPVLWGTLPAMREGIPPPSSGDEGSSLISLKEVPASFSASGSATNIGRAIRRSIESLGSAPVAGVVVLSDGGFNDGSSAAEAGQFARRRKLPIHVVGIGDPSPPRNVRITEVSAPKNVFQKDPFAVTARFASEGVEGETVQIRFRERDETSGGQGRIVDTKTVVVGAGGAIDAVTFQRSKDRLGRFTYTVEVVPVARETVTDDNTRQTTIHVIDSRTRVLLVAGGPSWDYRYLTRLLERDETFDVSCWLQSADISAVRDGNTVIDHLPVLAEELFPYDVVILMDPDPVDIDPAWCELLDRFVSKHSGGLLWTAARTHTPAFFRDSAFQSLLDLLPVTPDPEADLILNQVGHYQQKGWPVEIPDSTVGHPILQLADEPVSSRLIWQGMGEVYWHYPVLRAKSVATVLMRDSDPRMHNSFGGHVLAAAQFVGSGRTAFLGFDSTWRWRRYGEEIFDRFWVQMVRYLAEGKLLGGTTRGMMLTEGDQFSLGDAVTVTARLLDERFEPVTRDRIEATYEMEGVRGSFTLTAQRDRPGWYEGRFVPDRNGACRISLKVPGFPADGLQELSREIRVSRPNIEMLRPQMDREKLKSLAAHSEGGRYFEVDQSEKISSLMEDLHEEIPIRSRPKALWDNGMTMGWLLALLSVEWFMRKWNQLL